MKKEKTATVLEIQRMSTEDGPGIRTTVFFKGCSLRCTWCHNPESIASAPQLQWVESRCIGCRTCLEACTEKALAAGASGIVIDRNKCKGCGECAEACPSTALEIMGRPWGVNDLVKEVLKDRVYFETSGGGITASGGEAAMQPDAVAAFLETCRHKGVETALDTCGHVSKKAYEKILPHTDLLLFDMKLMDPAAHRRHTGAGNDRILANLLFIRDWKRENGRPGKLWIRTPVIPGATDTPENIGEIGAFLARHLSGTVDRWELCAFNNLCRDKYLRLGMAWPFADTRLMTEEKMEALCDVARRSGVEKEIVKWSGSVRAEEKEDRPPLLRVVDGCKT